MAGALGEEALGPTSKGPLSLVGARREVDLSIGGAGLNRAFEEYCSGLSKRFLQRKGFFAISLEEGEGLRIASASGNPRGDEVDFLSKESFAVGEFTLYLKSVENIKKFLSKIERVKTKAGREESPILVFYAFRVNERIVEEAVKLPDSANCHWQIAGRQSAGMAFPNKP